MNGNNKFDNTHILIAQPPANPNAVPEDFEPGAFPPPIHPPHLHPLPSPSPVLNPAFLNQQNGSPPSYTQSINQNPPTIIPSVVVINLQLGPYPASIQCPYCQYHIITKVTNRAGLLSWVICCCLALIGCWPFCLLPFCLRRCQDTIHSCPQCHAFISKYSRI